MLRNFFGKVRRLAGDDATLLDRIDKAEAATTAEPNYPLGRGCCGAPDATVCHRRGLCWMEGTHPESPGYRARYGEADEHFARKYLDHLEATTVNPVLLRAVRAARADLTASSSAAQDGEDRCGAQAKGVLDALLVCEQVAGHVGPHVQGRTYFDSVSAARDRDSDPTEPAPLAQQLRDLIRANEQLTAERDEAVAAVQRVRAAADTYAASDRRYCDAGTFYDDVIRALDDLP